MYPYLWLFPEENNLFFIDDLILPLLFAVAIAHRQIANLLLLRSFPVLWGLGGWFLGPMFVWVSVPMLPSPNFPE